MCGSRVVDVRHAAGRSLADAHRRRPGAAAPLGTRGHLEDLESLLTDSDALASADGLRRDNKGDWSPTPHTSPTDVATYLWSVLAAEELRIIGPDAARDRIGRTLATLERMERPHGFFYNDLDPANAAPLLAIWPGGP